MKRKLNFELKLFDGDGGATAPIGNASDTAQTLTPAADAQPQAKPNASSSKEEASKENAELKNAEFEKLIKGEFKEQFGQRVKENLNRRFKETNAMKERISQGDEIMNMLKIKYGVNGNDTKALLTAIREDDGFIKEEAQRKGMDVESLKHIRQLEFENTAMKEQRQAELQAMQADKAIRSWIADTKELTAQYPDFNLETEIQNPEFAKLLKNGASLKSAYFALHHDTIVNSLVERATENAKRKTAETIRARNARPFENGLSSQSSAVIRTDVSRLTPQQRAEIAKRVSRGEEISFC